MLTRSQTKLCSLGSCPDSFWERVDLRDLWFCHHPPTPVQVMALRLRGFLPRLRPASQVSRTETSQISREAVRTYSRACFLIAGHRRQRFFAQALLAVRLNQTAAASEPRREETPQMKKFLIYRWVRLVTKSWLKPDIANLPPSLSEPRETREQATDAGVQRRPDPLRSHGPGCPYQDQERD